MPSIQPPESENPLYPLSVLALSSSTMLYSEGHFLKMLSPLGVTLHGFRALLRHLSIPVVQIGRIRYVSRLWFEVALLGLSRPGQPNFIFPSNQGSRVVSTARHNKKTRGRPAEWTSRHTMNPNDLTTLLGELLLARHITHTTPLSAADLRSGILKMAREALSAGRPPSAAFSEFTAAALSNLEAVCPTSHASPPSQPPPPRKRSSTPSSASTGTPSPSGPPSSPSRNSSAP